MKKWQIITSISIVAVIILTVLGFVFYRFYMVPRYLNPLAEKFSEYVRDDRVLDSLYADADRLHDEGVLTDSVYTKFIAAYNKRNNLDLEHARDLLAGNESEDTSDSSITRSSLSAKYASHKVSLETIQANDENSGGKSGETYSSSRTSERTRAEDRLEAERIIDEANSAAEATEQPELTEELAYKTLKENMTSSEYSTLVSIIGSLDRNMLKGFFNSRDKNGLNDYLLSNLSDSDYRTIVNLIYKYADLFSNYR